MARIIVVGRLARIQNAEAIFPLVLELVTRAPHPVKIYIFSKHELLNEGISDTVATYFAHLSNCCVQHITNKGLFSKVKLLFLYSLLIFPIGEAKFFFLRACPLLIDYLVRCGLTKSRVYTFLGNVGTFEEDVIRYFDGRGHPKDGVLRTSKSCGQGVLVNSIKGAGYLGLSGYSPIIPIGYPKVSKGNQRVLKARAQYLRDALQLREERVLLLLINKFQGRLNSLTSEFVVAQARSVIEYWLKAFPNGEGKILLKAHPQCEMAPIYNILRSHPGVFITREDLYVAALVSGECVSIGASSAFISVQQAGIPYYEISRVNAEGLRRSPYQKYIAAQSAEFDKKLLGGLIPAAFIEEFSWFDLEGLGLFYD